MDEIAEQKLLADVKSFTDRMDLVDQVFKQLQYGRNMVVAFRCGHSELLFPGDYLREWGRLYGIGLGPNPVSEVLDSDYHTDPPAITPEIESIEQIMHPLGVTFAQVDHVLVSADAFVDSAAILAKDDPFVRARARIIRAKQLLNPKGKLRLLQVAFERTGR